MISWNKNSTFHCFDWTNNWYPLTYRQSLFSHKRVNSPKYYLKAFSNMRLLNLLTHVLRDYNSYDERNRLRSARNFAFYNDLISFC